jgi:glycerophosphoryl diester phosphodiesterase
MFTIIGHRGSPHEALENSLESFRAAARAGLKWVELDVRITKDGVPAIFHDPHLRRMTGIPGRFSSLRFAELPPLLNKSRIPRLSDALGEFNILGLGVYVEIKEKHPDAIRSIIEVCRSTPCQQVISSFCRATLEQVRALWPEASTMALFDAPPVSFVNVFKKCKATEVGVAAHWISSRLAKKATDAGIALYAYTVNDLQVMEDMHKLGLSGVFSDRASLAKSFSN